VLGADAAAPADDLDAFLANLKDVNPEAVVVQVSARTGEGMSQWCAWLEAVRFAALPVASPA